MMVALNALRTMLGVVYANLKPTRLVLVLTQDVPTPDLAQTHSVLELRTWDLRPLPCLVLDDFILNGAISLFDRVVAYFKM